MTYLGAPLEEPPKGSLRGVAERGSFSMLNFGIVDLRTRQAGRPVRVNRDGSSLWLELAYVCFAPEAEAASMS